MPVKATPVPEEQPKPPLSLFLLPGYQTGLLPGSGQGTWYQYQRYFFSHPLTGKQFKILSCKDNKSDLAAC